MVPSPGTKGSLQRRTHSQRESLCAPWQREVTLLEDCIIERWAWENFCAGNTEFKRDNSHAFLLSSPCDLCLPKPPFFKIQDTLPKSENGEHKNFLYSKSKKEKY
jgi:hypothetical protein